MLTAHEISIRVRYCETDAMGFLHHANFRDSGSESGCHLSSSVPCPRYDDLLTLRTQVERVSAAKIEHSYRLSRNDQVLATASSVLACVDKSGRVQRLPESLSTHAP
ncbi:MAG: hypothetical protein B7Z55_12280 [Planctomycetales bacterium 12-60-4]|nr:MAG: hypothetical protein B7Z55_12280 [Planctomycetales bacterium 12-60-4]